MMENILTASTNIVGFYTAGVCNHRGFKKEASYICLSAILSFLYHSYESRRHNMSGIFKSPLWVESLLLNLDRMSAILNVVYWQYVHSIFERYTALCVSMLYVLLLSEVTHSKVLYLVLHNLWHISVFLLPLVVI